MQSTFTVVLGCCRFSHGHIDPSAGIFGVLIEHVRKVRIGIIPARSNTDCKNRRTRLCSMECHQAVYGILSGGKISWRKKGKRI